MIRSRADCAPVSLRKRKMKGNMQSQSRFLYTCRGVGIIERRGIKGWGRASVALSIMRKSRVEVEFKVEIEDE